MLDEMRVNDEQLEVSDIRRLESADEIAHFFAKLRYNASSSVSNRHLSRRHSKREYGPCKYWGKCSHLACWVSAVQANKPKEPVEDLRYTILIS